MKIIPIVLALLLLTGCWWSSKQTVDDTLTSSGKSATAIKDNLNAALDTGEVGPPAKSFRRGLYRRSGQDTGERREGEGRTDGSGGQGNGLGEAVEADALDHSGISPYLLRSRDSTSIAMARLMDRREDTQPGDDGGGPDPIERTDTGEEGGNQEPNGDRPGVPQGAGKLTEGINKMTEIINGLELLILDIFTFVCAVVGLVFAGRLWEQKIIRKRAAAAKATDAVS